MPQSRKPLRPKPPAAQIDLSHPVEHMISGLNTGKPHERSDHTRRLLRYLQDHKLTDLHQRERLTNTLTANLGHPDPAISTAAARPLALLGHKKAVPALLAAIARVKRSTDKIPFLEALARFRPNKAAPNLMAIARSKTDEKTRQEALRVLGTIPDRQIPALLIKTARESADEYTRLVAAQSIMQHLRMRNITGPQRDAIQQLVRNEPSTRVRYLLEYELPKPRAHRKP